MKHLTSKILLLICWVSVLGALLSFWSLNPISQHLHILYAPLVRLSLGLYLFSLFLIPIVAIAGLVITLLRKDLCITALYITLIPIWFYVVTAVGNAV